MYYKREKELREEFEQEITLESIEEAPPLKKDLKLYLETISLYKAASENPDSGIFLGTVEALSPLASIDPELFVSLYEKGIYQPFPSIRKRAVEALPALAPVNSELFVTLCKKVVEHPDPEIREASAKALSALAKIDPKLFVSLYEKGLIDDCYSVRIATVRTLPALAPIDSELFVFLYEKGLKNRFFVVQSETAKALSALAPINPDLFVSLCEKAFKDPDRCIREGTVKALPALAKINPELFVSLYEKGIKDDSPFVREETAKAISALAPINPELFVSFCEKAFKNPDEYIRGGAAKALPALAKINSDLFVSLCEKAFKDPDEYVRQGAAKALPALAKINPELFVSLYKKGLEDEYLFVRKETIKALSALAPINPKLFVSLYEETLELPYLPFPKEIGEALVALAPVNSELFVTLCKKVVEHPDPEIREASGKALSALAKINPKLFVSLYEKGIKDDSLSVRKETAKALSALAPIDQELFIYLYEKGLKHGDFQVRKETAKALSALAESIKIPEREVFTFQHLKSLIKTYGFSLKKRDIEFFRRIIPFFEKELGPFLESKELPKTLKYQMKIALIESLGEKELLDFFKEAVTDFNLALREKTKESRRERRIILEFLTLLPISEASHFLATQAEKVLAELGDLNSIDMRTFKALADTNTREGNRLLLTILNQPNLHLRRREYILRKLIQNKVLEEELLDYLGEDRKGKLSFFNSWDRFQKEFPGMLPTPALFDLYINQGMSISEIREKKEEFEKKDLPFEELISKLAQDRNLANLYFAFYPSPYIYDNILPFHTFYQLLKDAENLGENNEKLKAELSTLWQKKGRSQKEIAQFLKNIQRGVKPSEIVIKTSKEQEKDKLRESSLKTIENLTRNLINLEPIFALSGRLQGLLKKDKEKLKEIQEKIAKFADSLDISSDAVFQPENLQPLYKKLYQEYQKILREREEEKIPPIDELYQKDLNKAIALFKREGFFTDQLVFNREKSSEEIANFVSRVILKRLRLHSKKQGEISEKFQKLIENLKREIEICLDNLSLKIETKPLRLTIKQVPKIDFKSRKHLIEFMRIGDARESCVATNGTNSWTIPSYLKDFATIGFLILDQNKAIGHIFAHLGKDHKENPILLANTIYLKGEYPLQAVSQEIALYLENFARETGLSEVLFAYSPFSEIVPPNYEKVSRLVQRLQGVETQIYSDFRASTESLIAVECYQKIKIKAEAVLHLEI